MNYKVKKTKRKTLSITVDHKGEVCVHSPMNVSNGYIERFIAEKQCWIDKKIELSKQKEAMFQSVLCGKQISIMGCLFDIRLCECKLEAEFTENCVLIVGRYNTNKKIRIFLKKKCYDYCLERLNYISRATNLCYDRLQMSNSQRYWGLCTSKKLIKINIRLIMLPKHLIDYVLIHELCHTVHLNHSKCFWQLLGSILPCYKQYREELKLYSRFLELYRDEVCL